MDIEQIKKHKDIMKWFIDNPEKSVWTKDTDGWTLTKTPQFYRNYKYVKNDEHSDIRKDFADGKKIEYYSNSCWLEFIDEETCSIDYIVKNYNYRIKPDFYIGDWITNGTNVIQVVEDHEWTGIHDSYKHWKPTVGNWCLFFDDEYKYYTLDKLKRIDTNSDKTKYYTVNTNTYYYNVKPLEFATALKGKKL